jgi:hypothetical protein
MTKILPNSAFLIFVRLLNSSILLHIFQVRLARRRSGIEPYLPPESDRVAMKLKYAKTGAIPLTPGVEVNKPFFFFLSVDQLSYLQKKTSA